MTTDATLLNGFEQVTELFPCNSAGPRGNHFGAKTYLDWCQAQAAWATERGRSLSIHRERDENDIEYCCLTGTPIND